MSMCITILQKSLEHLFISMTALFAALCLALPLGFYLSQHKKQHLSRLTIRAISLIQTFPGLAMIAVIVVTLVSVRKIFPLPTTGFLPGILALSLYGLSPILTNTYTGLLRTSFSMIEVAKSLGMTSGQILFRCAAYDPRGNSDCWCMDNWDVHLDESGGFWRSWRFDFARS